jgi:hypothetical protein
MQVVAKEGEFKGVWIDMESSLRSLILEDKDSNIHRDVFSVEKCMVCIEAGLLKGMPRAEDK